MTRYSVQPCDNDGARRTWDVWAYAPGRKPEIIAADFRTRAEARAYAVARLDAQARDAIGGVS